MDMECPFPIAEISQFTALQNLNISNNESLTGNLDKLNAQYICFMAQVGSFSQTTYCFGSNRRTLSANLSKKKIKKKKSAFFLFCAEFPH